MQWELKWPSSGKKSHLDPGISSHHDEFKGWILMLNAAGMRHAFSVMEGYMSQRPGREEHEYWIEGEAVLCSIFFFFFFMLGWYITFQPKWYNLNCAILENELHYKNILVMHRAKHIKCTLEVISYLSFSNWHWREWTWKLGLSAGS